MVTPNFNWAEVSASQNQKEVTINDTFNKIEDALSNVFTAAITASNTFTLTETQFRENFFFNCTDGGITAAATLNVPSTVKRGVFAVTNNSGFPVTVQISGQSLTPPVVEDGELLFLSHGGSNVRKSAAGALTFLGLTDTPSAFTGQGLKAVRVNAGESALEFGDVAGSGGAVPTVAVTPAYRGALVRKTGNQALSTGFPGDVLTWDAEEYDTDTIHDNATNNSRLTVPTGVTKIRLSANVRFAAVDTDDKFIGFFKNGTTSVYGLAKSIGNGSSANTDRRNMTSAVISVVAGDYFEVTAWAGVSGTVLGGTGNEETWFAMEIVETSDSQQLPTAFIAVQPKHEGALVELAGNQSIPNSTTTEVIWGQGIYDTTFQPNDAGGPQRFWLGADRTFVDADVTVAADTITETGHDYTTGEGPVQLTTTGTLPTGLATGTNYWIISVDANTIAFAASRNLALAGTKVGITAAAGGGTHTIEQAKNLLVPAGVTKIRVHANSSWASASGGSRFLTLQKNGAAVTGIGQQFTNGSTITSGAPANLSSATIEVSEGDRISATVFHQQGAALNLLDNTSTFFAIEVVETTKPLTFPGVTVERPHIGCFLTMTADVGSLAAATSNALPFNEEQRDTGYRGVQFHDTATNNSRITIPAGITKVRLKAGLGMSGTTGVNDIRFWRNGAAITEVDVMSRYSTSNPFHEVVSPVLDVSEGDYFEFVEFHTSGTGTALSAQAWFAMEVVETEEAAQPPLDLSFFVGGAPTAGQKIGKHVATRRFELKDEMAGSKLHAGTAATAASVFTVLRNGASIGTITVAASGTTGTFTTTGSGTEVFAIGDYLEITAPNPADATLADIAITLFGFRS